MCDIYIYYVILPSQISQHEFVRVVMWNRASSSLQPDEIVTIWAYSGALYSTVIIGQSLCAIKSYIINFIPISLYTFVLSTHCVCEALCVLRYSPFLNRNIQEYLLVQAVRPKYWGSCLQATPITSWSFVHLTWPGERSSGIPDKIVMLSVAVSRTATTGRCLPTNCSPQCGL